MISNEELKQLLEEKKFPVKIVDWGYTEEDAAASFEHFNHWIAEGKHGPLKYLADHRAPLREKLSHYYPKFSSALSFLFDYSGAGALLMADRSKVARYVLGFQGVDYHLILKEVLNEIAETYKLQGADCVLSLDVHPVLERDLAYRAGLGWFGKNSMLISRAHGSYFILGSILFDRKLNYSMRALEQDHCGTCRACIDACPTKAINEETRTLNSEQCISTYTIELFKDAPPPPGMKESGQWIYGCDICQEVCPWNKKIDQAVEKTIPQSLSPMQKELKEFFMDRPLPQIISDLENLSNGQFIKKFSTTPLSRTGRVGLLKNLKAYL